MWEGLGKFLAPILTALLEAFFAYRRDEQAGERREQLGAAKAAATVNKESADAADRMAKANAAPHSRDDALARLREGSA